MRWCFLLLVSSATACIPGQYLNAAQCVACLPGTFTVNTDSTTCSQCSAGQFSTAAGATSCRNCNATQFSHKSGSTTCYKCPANTGSRVASSACVSCATENPTQCIMADNTFCKNCSSACSTCQPGHYGGGPTKCKNCPAGTFASVSQLTSVSDCSTCPIGTATRQTDTGASACQTCTAVGRPLPNSSHSAAPGQTCRWECDRGVVLMYSNENGVSLTLLNSIYSSQGFFNLSTADLLNLYHRDTDYCCDSSVVGAGQWLSGCSSASNGKVLSCTLSKNAEFLFVNENKLNRCDDWRCKFGFYRIGSICASQPTCRTGQTWKRDFDGTLMVTTNGTFSCVSCSTCLAGTETMRPCNATVDTICRRCDSTSYSLSGSTCVSSVPLGYHPVRVQYSSQPAFQGRPTFNSDNSLILFWPQSMYLFTYTTCAPINGKLRYSPIYNDPCLQTDPTSTTQCQPGTLACETECKPWNGTKGWFGQYSACTECVFDPAACFENQFLSISTCGPILPPQCVQCPITPPPNANPFTNPHAVSTGTPYPCAFTCVNQYVKSNNKSTCINCKPIPNGAAFDMSGCTWHCQQGYVLNATENGCEPCEPPPECVIGLYPDYDPSGQCMVCQPCLVQVPNSQFISTGQPQSPNSCGFECDPGFWFSDNPLGCYACNPDISCIAGHTYFTPCTSISDASCILCYNCQQGQKTMSPCTPLNDVQCGSCNPSLLPPNASWGLECAWACKLGFILEPPTFCRRCMAESECRIDQQLILPNNGCGRCDPCPALVPGTQYIGDGQCGTEYITGCNSRPYPLGATKNPSAAAPICPWTCNPGFTPIPAEEPTNLAAYIANYLLLSLPPQDENTMTALFHRNTDACCNISRVGAGKRLVGCSQTFAGSVQNCPPVNDSIFVFDGSVNKIDRCSDYACKPGFFIFNTSEGCKPMPACKGNQTLNRDTNGNLLFNSDNTLSCVPCSTCFPGSQPLQACNQSTDVVCQLCNASTPFSAANGPCLSTPPPGFAPVSVYHALAPAFQGRPFNSAWPNTLFTFSPCAPKATDRQYTAWTITPCPKNADNATACLNLTCPTECSQWNGKTGWYQSPTNLALCVQCLFRPTACSSSQYMDMTVCGPTRPPACLSCNQSRLPQNASQWKTPTDILFNSGPYQCDFNCSANYSKYNFTCVNCSFIPLNAILTQGCQWKCARGFVQSGVACVQCKAPSCALGSYIDFTATSSQCPECIPCNSSVLFLDTVFTSASSCVFDCLPTYFAPAGIHPLTKNPLGPCSYCNLDQSCAKGTYLTKCQSSADSICAQCSQCDPGFKVTSNCTPSANTVCSACSPLLLPTGAVWVDGMCSWICPNGKLFVQSSFSCGPAVPLFSTTHSSSTKSQTTTTTTTTPKQQTTSTKPKTTATTPFTTAPQQFVSLLTVTIPTGTGLKLTDILTTVANESQCVRPCVAQLLSVTDPTGKITICQNNSCQSIFNTTRRLLLSTGWIINVGFVSPAPLPPTPIISISQNTLSNFNAPISAEQARQMLQNSEALLNYIASITPPPQSSSSSYTVIIITVAVVVGFVLACGCCFLVLILCQIHQRKKRYQPIQQQRRMKVPGFGR